MSNQELNKILEQNCFEVFGLTTGFDINPAELNAKLHSLQKEFHPDNWINNVAATDALNASSHINSCYAKLKNPLERALLILSLNSYPLDLARDTDLPEQFLFEQMEFHEQIDEAGENSDKLEIIEHTVTAKQKDVIDKLSIEFAKHNYTGALELTKQLGFYQRLFNQISDKISLIY